jgi:hypothetical protein
MRQKLRQKARRPAGSKAAAPVSAGTFDSYGLARYHPARVSGGLDRATVCLFSRAVGLWVMPGMAVNGAGPQRQSKYSR